MQYDVSVELDLPREQVVALFDDPANLPKWQRGLQSFTSIEGIPGQVGAKSKLVFDFRGREMVMIETITRRDLPDAFDGTYEAGSTLNIVQNRFVELPAGRTRWEAHNVFELKGFLKLMGMLMPGMFKKQSLQFMQDFKAFAEDGADVRDAG